VSPTEVIGRADLLPIMMEKGLIELGRKIEAKLPAFEVVWLEGAESVTQSVTAGGVKDMVLKELANDY
jgi:hypothetical protein